MIPGTVHSDIAASYKLAAGFAPDILNRRPSLSVVNSRP